MAKKGFGKLIVFAAVAGAVAAGISYFKKYKTFNEELEEEFHDFEGDDTDEEEDDYEKKEDTDVKSPERNYVSLKPSEDKSEIQNTDCKSEEAPGEDIVKESTAKTTPADAKKAEESEANTGMKESATVVEDDEL